MGDDALEIGNSALDLSVGPVRDAYVEQKCSGDPELKARVLRYIAFADEPLAGIDPPPSRALAAGTRLGQYEVLAFIAAGGMGEVYRARDTRLLRDVALKLLPVNKMANFAGRDRFLREARAASALNHPNIVTVYDLARDGDLQFIVMEYLPGKTIDQLIPMDLTFGLRIACQVAGALAKAHTAGIVHRDIKPGNIMVAEDGAVKVLDFGLATLEQGIAGAEVVQAAPLTETGAMVSTSGYMSSDLGRVMGTPHYMSPEQASGAKVDARTDIFSLGVVLYEMIAGSRPFDGNTVSSVIVSILEKTPKPLSKSPVALRAVVEKALEKNPAERYQSMREMAVDLQRLALQHPMTTGKSRERLWWAIAGIFIAAVLIATALTQLRFRHGPAEPAGPQYTQLTNFVDSATSPALSPDGRMLAFIRGESTFFGPGQIYVKRLPDGEPVQLTRDDLDKMSPKFSPDGAHITYTVYEGGSKWNTWVVSVLGGKPRLFLANAEGLTWIKARASQPRLLFSEMTGRGYQMGIVASSESRAQRHNIYMPAETGMAHRSYLSPDQKQVIVIEMNSGTWLPCRLTAFDGSSLGRSVGPMASQCTDASWSPDGKWMYFSVNDENGYHIWRQRFPDGVPEQVTSGVTAEEGIEFASDGHSFVTSIGTSQSTVWFHDSRGDRQITSEGYGLLPSISPDGKKLYYLLRAGRPRNFARGQLWVADLESGVRQRLLPDFLMQHYTISADGQRVVFVAVDDTGHSPVWLSELYSRSAPRRLTTKNAFTAFFGVDAEVVFFGEENGANLIHRITQDGHELQKVVPPPGSYLFNISLDGKWAVLRAPTDGMATALIMYPLSHGSPILICGTCARTDSFERGPGPPFVSWSPDGKFLYLSFQRSIYAIPIRPGQILPPIPASGFRTKRELTALPGARLIADQAVFAGPAPSVYSFTKLAIQRNIYRVAVQ